MGKEDEVKIGNSCILDRVALTLKEQGFSFDGILGCLSVNRETDSGNRFFSPAYGGSPIVVQKR